MASPAATGATRRRFVRPTRSTQTTSSAPGAASRRNTSSRAAARRATRFAYSFPVVASLALAVARRSPPTTKTSPSSASLATSIVPSRASMTVARRFPTSASASTACRSVPARASMPLRRVRRIGGEVARERIGRVVGKRVGLVDDHDVVIRQDATLGREVRAVQRVVDDEDGHLVRAVPCSFREALGAVGALGLARTLRTRAADRRPRRRIDLAIELGTVAGLRSLGELAEVLLLATEVRADRLLEQRVGRAGGPQLRAAHIVRPALEQREREADASVLAQRRKVLADELALQRDRRRRDDDLQTRRDGRHEVREALARTGRRFGDEMMATDQRVTDRGGELVLPRARLASDPGDHRVEQRERIGSP